MRADPGIYLKLTKSMCPSVFGHDSIKQAVMLMLFGGVHKRTKEVCTWRGLVGVIIAVLVLAVKVEARGSTRW